MEISNNNNAIDIVTILKRLSSLVDDYEDLQQYDTIHYPFFNSSLSSAVEPVTYMVNNILEIIAILDFIESPVIAEGSLVWDSESEKYTIEGTYYSYSYNHLVEFWDSNVKSYRLAKIAYSLKHKYVAVTLDNVHRMVLLDGLKVRYRGITKIKDVMCSSFLPESDGEEK